MDPRALVLILVILPVLSVCLGFTVHFVIRPMVESLVDALHEVGRFGGGGQSGPRVERLEAEVHALRQELRQLRAETHSGPALPPGGSAGTVGDGQN